MLNFKWNGTKQRKIKKDPIHLENIPPNVGEYTEKNQYLHKLSSPRFYPRVDGGL